MAAGLVALLVGFQAGGAEEGPPRAFLAALVTLAALAGLHRPFDGSTLGVGTVSLPTLVATAGAFPSLWMAPAALLLADVVRRFLRKNSPYSGPERRHLRRSLENAGALVASLAAGIGVCAALEAWVGTGRLAALAAGGGVYLVALATFRILDKKLRRPLWPIPWKPCLLPLVTDIAAWGVGLAVAKVALQGELWTATALVAGLAALALETTRHSLRHGVSRQRVQDLERLNQAAQGMARGQAGLGSVAGRILEECQRVMRFPWFQFEVLARETGYQSWWSGPDGHLHRGEPRPPPAPPALPGIHKRSTWMLLERPLESDQQLIGRLRLWCDPRRIEEDSLELFEDLMPQIRASLERSLLDRQARRDPLTGLALRRVLELELERMHHRACEDGGSFSLILLDLDHFKSINDTHGHAAGDVALADAARVLLDNRRDGDLCARYGGEEFTVLLEGLEGRQALRFADRLRRRIEQLRVEAPGADGEPVVLPLTVSSGVAAFPELHVKTPGELLELADAALYEAKDRGRNRCLLNLGRGRFESPEGEILDREPERPTSEVDAPRIFA